MRPPAPHRDGPLGSSGAAPIAPASPPAAKAETAPAATEAGAKPAAGADTAPGRPAANRSRSLTPAGAEAPIGTAPGETVIPSSPLAEAKEAAAVESAARAGGPRTAYRAAGPKPGTTTGGTGSATSAAAAATGPAAPTDGVIDLDKSAVTVASSSGGRVARVLRHANPVRAARTAGRSTRAWARRPIGRLVVPAVIAALLLGAAGTAGAYLVPQALKAGPSPSATPGFPPEAAAPGPSGAAALPSLPPPENSGPPVPEGGAARPADALAGWAQGVGTRVGIPVVAVQAYGYAELVAARTAPTCRLTWTTLAAIAKVESAHGSANGAVLGADGSVQPPIYGLPLDGKGGRQLIRDTDQGALDADTTFDRAMGPMQFIPATWQEMKVDADNSGFADPNDIDDAAVAAALYLCRGGRDMSRAAAWWEAILTYNAVQPYAQKVFDAANEYGRRSRV